MMRKKKQMKTTGLMTQQEIPLSFSLHSLSLSLFSHFFTSDFFHPSKKGRMKIASLLFFIHPFFWSKDELESNVNDETGREERQKKERREVTMKDDRLNSPRKGKKKKKNGSDIFFLSFSLFLPSSLSFFLFFPFFLVFSSLIRLEGKQFETSLNQRREWKKKRKKEKKKNFWNKNQILILFFESDLFPFSFRFILFSLSLSLWYFLFFDTLILSLPIEFNCLKNMKYISLSWYKTLIQNRRLFCGLSFSFSFFLFLFLSFSLSLREERI